MFSFVVRGVPVAQPRQRMRVVGKKTGGSFVQNYTPESHPVHTFKELVVLAAGGAIMQCLARGLPEGPVEVRLTFVMPRPKKLKKGGRVPFSRKPDFDNLAKSLCDALNGHVWVDDSQVCRSVIEKWYAGSEEQPHVAVEILPFPGDPPKAA